MLVQYLPISNFAPISYITLILPVFIIKNGGFLTVDCGRGETACNLNILCDIIKYKQSEYTAGCRPYSHARRNINVYSIIVNGFFFMATI